MVRMTPPASPGIEPDTSECVEQAYFFRTFRERIEQNLPAQEVLSRLHEELIATTRLPLAVQFLATEMKHTGLLGSGLAKLPHYFTPFQTFVVQQSEDERKRFTTATALLVLEREAVYKAAAPTRSGLFVYQFESIARNRLGYDAGLAAAAQDPIYGPHWSDYIDLVRRQVGAYDFSDLVYVRSEQYVTDQRRANPAYHPSVPPLFGEKEGKIAKASRGRDPLFLFAALQRHLNYPEVPRPRSRDDVSTRLEAFLLKVKELEARLRVLEAENRGTFDPTQFGKPDLLRDDEDS